ncbi:MAG TPA: tRNA pseudouridine(55) synthase TruB [Acidimicrobiales bacterium]|nr:tRNA pseudouridine(55) synthase TruB [Acidimicrobiales bacterium]
MADGLLVVDKPAGMTSHDVVARCRRLFSQRRVGHGGTLDPDATGVLLVGLGSATRLLQYMTILPKSYTAEMVLGAATSTLDAAGSVVGEWDMSAVTLAQARSAAASLTGDIMQVPPMVSAVKVAGRRLHELAREGVTVAREPRPVKVHRFEVISLRGGVLDVEVDCSSGTYVRVLADDLGRALGGGAHLRNLRRTAVGPWTVDSAVSLDDVGPARLLAPSECLPWMEAVTATPTLAGAVGHGAVLPRAALGLRGPGPWRILSASGDLIAVYEAHGELNAKPKVVLGVPSV